MSAFASAGLLAAVLIASTPQPTRAAEPAAKVSSFEIAAQPLSSALILYGRQARVQVIAPGDGLEQVRCQPVSGKLSAAAAIARLLDSTGLVYQFTSGNTVVIAREATPTPHAAATALAMRTERLVRADEAAGAPASPEPQSSTLEEVIVTSQKRAEPLQRTPIAITALSSADLTATGTTNTLDLNTRVPNLFVGGAGAGGRFAGAYYIRGIGVDTDTLAKEPGVGIYIDDFYYGHTAGSLLSVLDVESIEVLRGPQGTLFGKNTIGGAVRYTSVKPSLTPRQSLEISRGSMDRMDVKGSLNFPLGDTFALRLSGGILDQDGFVHSIPLDKDLGDDHTRSARAQLRYMQGPWDVVLSADYNESHSNGGPTHLDAIALSATSTGTLYNKIVSGTAPVPFYNTGLYAGLTPARDLYDSRYLAGEYETYATNVGYKLNGHGVNLTASYQLGDGLELKSLTGYRKNTLHYKVDNDQSPLAWNGNVKNEWLPSFSQELQLLGNSFNERLKYIAGLYYYRETPHEINERNFPGEPDGNTQLDDVKTTSIAAFAQLDYNLTERLKLTLGGRYSDDEKDAFTERRKVLLTGAGLAGAPERSVATPPGFVATTATTFGPVSGAGNKHWSAFSPKAALAMQWTPTIMTYASGSRGYRSGGFNNGIAVYNPATGANPNNGILPFDNETVTSYEIGARTEFLDRRLRFNVSAFDADYRDLQVSASQGGIFILIANVAKARLKGFESDVAWRVLDDLTLGGNYGYLDAKYTSVGSAVQQVTAIDTNSRLAGAPARTYSVFANYAPTLPNTATLAFNVNWGHQSEVASATSTQTAVILPAYGLLGASIFYHFPNRELALGVTGKNLLDKRYLLTGVNLIPAAAGNAGMQLSSLGRPREVFATLQMAF